MINQMCHSDAATNSITFIMRHFSKVLLISAFSVFGLHGHALSQDADFPPQPSSVELSEPPAQPAQGLPNLVEQGNQDVVSTITPEPSVVDAPQQSSFYDSEEISEENQLLILDAGPVLSSPDENTSKSVVKVKKAEEEGSVQSRLIAAQRALTLNRYDAAIEMFRSLYQTNPRDVSILIGLALSYQNAGQNEEAIQIYQEILDVEPKHLEARINMLGLMGDRYPAVALRRLISLEEEYKDNPAILAQIAVMQANVGDYGSALKYMNMASSIEPQNAMHIFNLAVIADRAGDKDTAISSYERALEVDSIYSAGGSIPRDQIFERLAQLR